MVVMNRVYGIGSQNGISKNMLILYNFLFLSCKNREFVYITQRLKIQQITLYIRLGT